ncbi:MAG TPA: GNAT family N-acetyltransferase [Candidatus Baltobacteraceae bacterium]|nr:GNAT family N-acetyltransferase [Candidatus Baltobacteraceae bacterium]
MERGSRTESAADFAHSAGPEIRVARPEDAREIASIYAQYVSDTVVSLEERAPSEAEMRERIVRTLEFTPWLVASLNGRVAGYAYAQRHRERAAYRWAVDVSVYVDPALHRRRIGTALYRELFAILARQGFRRVCAGLTYPNAGSEGLHRAMGFVPIGIYRRIGWKFGRWHDTLWMQREIGGDEPPTDPVPFARLKVRTDYDGYAPRKGGSSR